MHASRAARPRIVAWRMPAARQGKGTGEHEAVAGNLATGLSPVEEGWGRRSTGGGGRGSCPGRRGRRFGVEGLDLSRCRLAPVQAAPALRRTAPAPPGSPGRGQGPPRHRLAARRRGTPCHRRAGHGVEGRGRREVDLICGPHMSGPRQRPVSLTADSLTRIKVVWTSRKPINKFGDPDVHFGSLGTGMTSTAKFRGRQCFYS